MGLSVDASVNWTASDAIPDTGLAEKSATTGGLGVSVTVTVGV